MTFRPTILWIILLFNLLLDFSIQIICISCCNISENRHFVTLKRNELNKNLKFLSPSISKRKPKKEETFIKQLKLKCQISWRYLLIFWILRKAAIITRHSTLAVQTWSFNWHSVSNSWESKVQFLIDKLISKLKRTNR